MRILKARKQVKTAKSFENTMDHRGAAADVVFNKSHELEETLKTLSTDTSVAPECRAKSRGLLQKLKSLPEMFNLVAMNELAYLLENNSKLQQSASLTAEQATATLTSITFADRN